MFLDFLRALLGVVFLLGLCYALSADRKHVNWRLVGIGMALQLVLGILLLRVPLFDQLVGGIATGFARVLGYAVEGATVVFGDVAGDVSLGGVLAFRVLPAIIFFSALTTLLYHLGILQKVVHGFAWAMARTMKLSGAESLAAAANVFIGQTEAPLTIRPYLAAMSRSELFLVMTGGMATVAGSTMAAYISMVGQLAPELEEIFGKHLIIASLLSAPAAVVAAKLIVPETETVDSTVKAQEKPDTLNSFDALVEGTRTGLNLALIIGAILIVFTALIAGVNDLTANWLGDITGLNGLIAEWTGGRYEALTLQFVLGLLFAPVAWLIGINSPDLLAAGQLLGIKTVLNEFIAYQQLSEWLGAGGMTNPHTLAITSFALCGFANFASMAILVAGIGTLAPEKRKTVAELAFPSLISGTVASLLTACIAGLLY
ncbi:MAG: NupC/NupG family nucleoside CNT transporter [Opitutales bacterium]